MATTFSLFQNPNPTKHPLSGYSTSIQRNQVNASFIGRNSQSLIAFETINNRIQGTRRRSGGSFSVSASTHTFDVVVVGAGIIGLSIARQFLLNSDLSVAVVDASLPCSGATGAGQGYIWMAHKIPGSETWNMAVRSQQLWQQLAKSMQDQGVDPLDELGWKKTGSLLVGQSSKEAVVLKKRVDELCSAGVNAEYLTGHDLLHKEPELAIGSDGCAAFLPDDAQLDANRTSAFIQKGNRSFASQGRYAEFYHDPAECFIISSQAKRTVEGVKTKNNTIYTKKALVVAAGCWTGSLMHDLIGSTDVVNVPVQPRKGCLLAVENFHALKLNHGLMEAGYIDHVSFSSAPKMANRHQDLSISMTATIDANGNLLLGSSRQFAGFNTELDMEVVSAIWARAEEFFPKLRQFSLEDLSDNRKIRIGLRPYMPDGKPVISRIPRMPNVYLAAGHEGSGLSLALGTAEMIVDMVLYKPLKVDSAPFDAIGRCC
ncbi:hypothetical protein V2J09_005060 [Rumex salicifolius]